jgi:hypothetical protein
LTPYLDTMLIDGMRVPEARDGVVALVRRAVVRLSCRMKEARLGVTEEGVA